jgi:hypothetical protein
MDRLKAGPKNRSSLLNWNYLRLGNHLTHENMPFAALEHP